MAPTLADFEFDMNGADGPIILALALGQQNNNNGANGANNGPNIPAGLGIVQSGPVLEFQPHMLSENRFVNEHVLVSGEQRSDTDTAQPINVGLDDTQLSFWNENGYLVIDNALHEHERSRLLADATNTIDMLCGQEDTARKQHLISEGQINVNPNGRMVATLIDGSTELEPIHRFRRCGTGVHRVLPGFRSLVFSDKNQQIASSLKFKDPRVTSSMIINKPATSAGICVPHIDGSLNFTDPPSCVTFWYALEDATAENGCLQVVPGSQRYVPITRACRPSKDNLPELYDLDRPVYAENSDPEGHKNMKRNPDGSIAYTKLEVKAGTLVLIHGNLLHTSDQNRSTNSRIAFNFNIVEGCLPWPKDAYVQPYDGHSEFERLEAKSDQPFAGEEHGNNHP